MIKTLLLIVNPGGTWEKIARAQRSILFILFLFIIPLIALSSAGEVYGLTHWGKERGDLNQFSTVPRNVAIDYVFFQFLLSLLVVFASAYVLKALGETFHGRHTYHHSFMTIAYSLGPLFLFRLLHTIPVMHWWMVWPIGIVFSLAVLYYGLGRMMQPDPTHALGLYFITAVLLTMTTFLAQLVAAGILKGKFTVIGGMLH